MRLAARLDSCGWLGTLLLLPHLWTFEGCKQAGCENVQTRC